MLMDLNANVMFIAGIYWMLMDVYSHYGKFIGFEHIPILETYAAKQIHCVVAELVLFDLLCTWKGMSFDGEKDWRLEEPKRDIYE